MLASTGDDLLNEAMDANTVRKLETLYSKTSVQNAELITRIIDDYFLFPQVWNDAD